MESFLYKRTAEYALTRDTHQVDKHGDVYIPLTKEVQTPLPFDPDHPGKGIMIHFMTRDDKHTNDLDTLRDKIVREGFITPRRYATFSTSPHFWFGNSETCVLVYRSITRWSREYNNTTYVPWVESLIGITEQEATALSPEAVSYHRNIRSHRDYLGWDIWQYIPPEHLLGTVAPHDKAQAQAFENEHYEVQQAYASGAIDEQTVIEKLVASRKDVPILGRDQALSQSEKDEFWMCYGASLTESALMQIISTRLNKWRNYNLPMHVEIMKPSLPFTKQLHEEALRLLHTP